MRWAVLYVAISGLHVINLNSHAIFHSFYFDGRCRILVCGLANDAHFQLTHASNDRVRRFNFGLLFFWMEQLISFARARKVDKLRNGRRHWCAIFTLTIVKLWIYLE